VNTKKLRRKMAGFTLTAILTICVAAVPAAMAVPVPGGTLDPTKINKYEIPLVIPPVMDDNGTPDSYNIAVRQFQQQILPGGIWAALGLTAQNFPPTTVWSYGPESDPIPDASGLGLPVGVAPAPNSQFNYPAYTLETMSNITVDVRWINDLVDPVTGNALEHILPVDQTLHWANPRAELCRDGTYRTDCATNNPAPYNGAVPIVTHVHGAHVDPDSDGYPEAWWLPVAADVDCSGATTTTDDDYVCSGNVFTGHATGNAGYADYSYRQDQPATTLWYHDHSLGMTRLNVYAGPAGFWLVRGGVYDGGTDVLSGLQAVLPGPAPVAGDTVLELNAPGVGGAADKRSGIREIPIVIQDRSFNADGSLFYPDNRAFFEGLNVPGEPEQFPGGPSLDIPFVGDPTYDSDIAPTWNPEAFFNVMVVNGVAWPKLEVAPALYRFRLLNGCNSRFLNLSMFRMHKKKRDMVTGKEIPFYQIGAEQGFLQNVVEIFTGKATVLAGDGTLPVNRTPGAFKDQGLLMGLAERADVIVDFRGLKNGDIIRMINTAPDAPFGGFPDVPADPGTTGQVMEFVVNTTLLGASPTDPGGASPATDPWSLQLNAEATLGAASVTRQVSLNEGESEELCVDVALNGDVVQALNSLGDPVLPTSQDPATGVPCFDPVDMMVIGFPMAPKEALLGEVDLTNPAMPLGIPHKWTANGIGVMRAVATPKGMVNVWVTENPAVGAVEDWEIYNFTADAHPIHQHLVRFNVIGRAPIPGWLPVAPVVQAWETNVFKDTVIAYPGEITTIRSHFDVAGLYVWHCHIVEHEDNEMMRPYFVGP
jgi:FtsP/CotA-like multicopper oxidase with cupredoxin domain